MAEGFDPEHDEQVAAWRAMDDELLDEYHWSESSGPRTPSPGRYPDRSDFESGTESSDSEPYLLDVRPPDIYEQNDGYRRWLSVPWQGPPHDTYLYHLARFVPVSWVLD